MKTFNFTVLYFTLVFSVLFSMNANSQADMKIWKDSVIGALYNAKTASVAFGKKDKKEVYHIFLSDSLGNNVKPLVYPEWQADRHQWAEEWHPNGEYLFCYVEKNEYVKEKIHKRKSVDATPGYGAYCDLWLIRKDGSKAWKLLDLPNSYNSGIIHSAISPDGTKFAWSERTVAPKFGNMNLVAGGYVLKIADIVLGETPHLENIKTFKPGNTDACNELDGISPDNKLISFYSTFESKNILATPIYTLNVETGEIKKLTTESFAQAATFTPDGKYLVYMTGNEAERFPMEIQGADWWIMNVDGSNKRRLTYMNVKNNPQSVNHYRLAGSLSFIDGTRFLGGIMTQPLGLTGYTAIVDISKFIEP